MATGKGATACNDILALLFQAQTWTSMAQNASGSPYSNLYVALHTSSPGSGGTQATNEAAYTSYARVAVVRTSSGWTVTGASVSPVGNIVFPAATGSPSETETYASIGVASSGSTLMLYYGPILPTIPVTSAGVAPILVASATSVTES